MISRATRRFWRCFDALPSDLQYRSRMAFATWRENPAYPGLQFKRVHPTEPIWSVRVSQGYRALGLREGDVMTWFWIGSHDAYERLLARR